MDKRLITILLLLLSFNLYSQLGEKVNVEVENKETVKYVYMYQKPDTMLILHNVEITYIDIDGSMRYTTGKLIEIDQVFQSEDKLTYEYRPVDVYVESKSLFGKTQRYYLKKMLVDEDKDTKIYLNSTIPRNKKIKVVWEMKIIM
jgi:hypothetical protein